MSAVKSFGEYIAEQIESGDSTGATDALVNDDALFEVFQAALCVAMRSNRAEADVMAVGRLAIECYRQFYADEYYVYASDARDKLAQEGRQSFADAAIDAQIDERAERE